MKNRTYHTHLMFFNNGTTRRKHKISLAHKNKDTTNRHKKEVYFFKCLKVEGMNF